MLPLQDVVPTRQTPVATLVVMGINAGMFLMQAAGASETPYAAPFTHVSVGLFAIALILLWLFGDHVEARLGRVAFVAIYLVGGWATGIAATGAVTAVLGSYFALLPRSRVLTLVPFPPLLIEVPAAFFLGVWTVLHLLLFISRPYTLSAFALAFVVGAAVARVMRRPIQW